jgi:hypothetical protein
MQGFTIMTTQRFKHFRLGVGILFLTFSGYYLPTYLQLQPVFAQATASQNTEADRLFQEAEQLVSNEAQFIQAFSKYQQALKLYRQSGDTTKAIATRQRLETVLAAASPLAEKFEQEMDKDEAAFLRQFPKTENNQTANKLEELARGQLGIVLIGRPGDSWTFSESQQKAFQDIKEELENYLNTQAQNASSSFSEVPPTLREYLEKNADKLTAIRTLLLNNESPSWATDMSWISEGNIQTVPSYLGLVYLQKLFAIDILHKQQQGKTKEVQEALEASWKLNQSIKNDPLVIGQLVGVIATRVQIEVIQKLNGLPNSWQQRLLEHDYRQSILPSLTGELLHSRSVYRRLMSKPETALEVEDPNNPFTEEFAAEYVALGWSEWSTSMQKNFLRWDAIATYQSHTDMYKVLAQENVCTWNFNNWRSTQEPIYGSVLDGSSFLSNWWVRAGRMMLELELTQKILQIKEMGANARNLPNVQSAICPNAQWTYQLDRPNGSSIALTPLPRWAAGVQRLPLIYNW